ncbi:MAG: SDR family oxidoreductase [Candidatus Dasytiphilus stammeri]
MNLLSEKKFLITGVANHRSIAFGIARSLQKYGAELAFTYQNKQFKNRVKKIANQFKSKIVLPCDVTQDSNIKDLFSELSTIWPKFDGLVHSICYAPSNQFSGNYIDCITRESFHIAHEISSYSFVALAQACRHMLNQTAALITISYVGAERTVTHYNVMGVAKASLEANVRYMAHSFGKLGVRVNAISAGPILTLASSGIKNFRQLKTYHETVSPLRSGELRIEEIGNAAVFLCSHLSAGITGEILHVDRGFSITAININNPSHNESKKYQNSF